MYFCVVSCWLHASGAFFACCSTYNVLILSKIISACSMSSEIHHLQLKFAFFLWLFFNCGWTFRESNNNKSFQIWWISETKRLVSTLRFIWSSISSSQIRQSGARCWTWIVHKTNKVVLALKRNKAKPRTNAKKVITGLCEKPGSGKRTCFGPRN